MRWGIASLYYDSMNLGGVLQAYAVTKSLEKMGYEAEQICYDLKKSNQLLGGKKKFKRWKKITLQKVWKHLRKIIEKKFKKPYTQEEITHFHLQSVLFNEFRESVPHSTTIYDLNTIKCASELYDGFLCGSDQVWGPSLLYHDFYTLNFVDSDKPKIAFAASMGKASLTADEDALLMEKAGKIQRISVREKTLSTYLKDRLGLNSQCILDPTLLLERAEWQAVADDAFVPEKPYVLCYFLGDSKWQRRAACQYAKENGLQLVHLPYVVGRKRRSDKVFADTLPMPVGPAQFLGLVLNAACIFTDSYHAMLFSLIFQKDFIIFNRDNETGNNSGCSRITDLLQILELENRFVTRPHKFSVNEQIDYESIKFHLDELKWQSFEWLQNAIDGDME
ncbi:MAG: polysaccharide pyruvyl transferase family protein [Clostridia bacterium]|nr:polysaccharide pyruvyl transferase family protein [Clostridia bacterium]